MLWLYDVFCILCVSFVYKIEYSKINLYKYIIMYWNMKLSISFILFWEDFSNILFLESFLLGLNFMKKYIYWYICCNLYIGMRLFLWYIWVFIKCNISYMNMNEKFLLKIVGVNNYCIYIFYVLYWWGCIE